MAKTRIPMRYVHTKERDSFYEAPPFALNGLPPSIRAQINPRHQAKLRVTTDQKTGKVIAKIIKVRVADLDIYSPHTVFDWRISVNLEMNYEGDIDGLVEGGGNSGKRADRIKDRVTYKHLAYQVDLTQVISDVSDFVYLGLEIVLLILLIYIGWTETGERSRVGGRSSGI
jgi:hypothetical protein